MNNQGDASRYNGPAPSPARSLDLNNGDARMDGPFLVDPETLTPGSPFPGSTFSATPGPSDPATADTVAKLESRMGELIRGLGEQRALYERQMKEMQLRHEASIASIFPSGVTAPAMDGDDPEGDGPVSKASLVGALKAFGVQTQAYINRAMLGMTAEEEAVILRQYPYLQSVPEPKKSELIREALSLVRESATTANTTPQPGDGKTTTAPGSASNHSVGAIVRSSPRVVPTPETLSPAFEAEIEPVNGVQNALQAYERAKQIKDPKQRLVAMKAAMQQAAGAQGVTPEALAATGWRQR